MKKQILICIILWSSIPSLHAQIYGTLQGSSCNDNVGIGTSTPVAKVDISSNEQLSERIRLSGQEFHNSGINYTEGVSILLGVNRENNRQLWIGDSKLLTRNSTNTILRFRAGQGSPSISSLATDGLTPKDLLIQSAAGNVGIGTETPNAKVDISNTGQFSERIRLSGQEFYQSGINSTNGISLLLGVNRDNNRQLWIGDSKSLTPNSTNTILRFSVGSTPSISAIATDGLTSKDLSIQTGLGNVGIGTDCPKFKLDVLGTIRAQEVKVDLQGGCDFVFKSDYKLMDLRDLENFVRNNQHLPEIAAEKDMVENGVNMKELQMKLLQKMEEMTLYIIEQNKKIEILEKKVAGMESASR